MTQKKKVVVGKSNKAKSKPSPKTSKVGSTTKSSTGESQMLYGKTNFMYMGIGVFLIALGMMLMSGGGMDDPNVWDESIIYSFRRITLAPILIVAGLVVEVIAIFK